MAKTIPTELMAMLNPPATTSGAIVPQMPTGQIAPTGQLVVQPRPTPTGGMKPVTGTATTVNPTALPGSSPRPPGMGTAARVASGLVKGGVVGAAFTPNTMGDGTIGGAIQNRLAQGESRDALIRDFGIDAVNQHSQIFDVTSDATSDMSRLGDEPLNFTPPTGASSTPTANAELPIVQPPESGLMGSQGVAAPAVPTSTFNVDQGSLTVPTALADQTIQDSLTPNQPLRNVNELVSSGRAAYGDQNLADFMANRDTPESATEQFVDPQGRLRRRDKATQELTSDYTDYERDAAAREQRAGESFGQARGPDSRDRDSGGISDADYRDMAKARVKGASAGDIARGQKVADRSGVDLASGESTAETPKTAYETKLEGLDVAQREANLAKTNAQIADVISSNNPDADVSDYSASQIGSLKKVMKDNDIYMKDGKLWVDDWGSDTELTEGHPDYDMIMGTEVGRAMLGKGAPKSGTTKSYQGKTYRFKGGDASDQNNWEEV